MKQSERMEKIKREMRQALDNCGLDTVRVECAHFHELSEEWREEIELSCKEIRKCVRESQTLPSKAYIEQAALESRVLMAVNRIEAKMRALETYREEA